MPLIVEQIEETLFKPHRPAGRGGGDLRRADPGRGRLPRRRRRASCRRCAQLCDQHGILLVVDEVQSGMGRTGQDVRGRALRRRAGHHLPGEGDRQRHAARGDHRQGRRDGLAAAAATPARSAATRSAAGPRWRRIDLLEREYMANAAARGEQLRAGLRELATKHTGLADVRGLGLMTAVGPARRRAHREKVIQAAFQRGLLLLGCGETAIRFCPPLCVTAEQVDDCLRVLDGVLGAVEPAKPSAAHNSGRMDTVPVAGVESIRLNRPWSRRIVFHGRTSNVQFLLAPRATSPDELLVQMIFGKCVNHGTVRGRQASDRRQTGRRPEDRRRTRRRDGHRTAPRCIACCERSPASVCSRKRRTAGSASPRWANCSAPACRARCAAMADFCRCRVELESRGATCCTASGPARPRSTTCSASRVSTTSPSTPTSRQCSTRR